MPARELRDLNVPTPAPTNGAPSSLSPFPSSLVVPLLPMQTVAVEMVLADFEASKLARDQKDYGTDAKGMKLSFDSWMKELTDLYFGRRLPKTVPWKFCSNRSLMIAMAILEVLHARIFPAVYNEELTHWRPTEVTDQERADRVEQFMRWWIRVRSRLAEFFDRWVRTVVGYGQALTVSRWDVQRIDRGETQAVSQPTAPVMEGGVPAADQLAPEPPAKLVERFETTRSEVISWDDVFLQPGATDVQRDTVLIRRRYLYRDLEEMEQNGVVVNVATASEPGVKALKELLPVPVPVSATLDPQQQEELANVKRRNQSVECLEWYGGIDLDGDGFPEQHRLLINPQHRLYLGGVVLSDLSARGMRHLDFTAFMPRLDDPMGLSGLGVLEQVKELALEIDAIFNQLTDANSLSVLRPFFYDPTGDLDAPAITLAPNKGTPVPNPSANIYFPQVDIPTERLLNAVKLVLEFIERLTAASAYVMGKESEIVGGSGTATRTEAILGAAGQRHSIPINRLRQGAARIMTQHLDLVQKNLPPGLESRVVGEKGEPIFENANELTQEGLRGEFDAYLLPDESFGSKDSERQLAQLLYQMALGNPIIMSDMSKLYKVTADLYKSYGKDPEQYLGITPDVKQTDRPDDENTLILQGNFASVKASILDNPIEHILQHEALLNDPGFQRLPPALQQQVATFIQAHIQEHLQMMQTAMLAAQRTQRRGGGNAALTNGAPVGAAGPAQAVGPEPSLGPAAGPTQAVHRTQRVGESQAPA